MKSKDGAFRQRVGALIEKHICKELNLYYNKRQRTQGHYDAYDDRNIYEIKASNTTNNIFIIRKNNHKRLCAAHGSYIFVSYKLKNKDKDLSVMSDIKITLIQIVNANGVGVNDKKTCKAFQNTPNKQYVKINLSEIKRMREVKNVL